MKSYDETISTVFRRMDEYETAKKRRRTLVLRTAAPLCCLLVLLGAWIFRPVSPVVTPPDTQEPTTAFDGPFLTATDPLPHDLDVVVINPIETVPSTQRMNIALHGKDFISMDQEELCAYYGTNVFPTVPNDLTCRDGAYGIFWRNGGTGEIYWDTNDLSFSNHDFSRNVTVNVTSGRIPVDFCNLFEDIENRSTINGVSVGIGKTSYGAFYAEFMYNETGFRVSAQGLDKEEFIDILKSLTA